MTQTMTKEQILANYQTGWIPSRSNIYRAMEEYAQQQLSAERERARNLVEALRTISNHSPEWDHISGEYTSQIIAIQTLNDYDTATKES